MIHVVIKRHRALIFALAPLVKIERGSGNVFLDIGFSPEDAEPAAALRLDVENRAVREAQRHDPNQAARALGVTQPRLNALLKGKIDQFSLDSLVNMLGRVGMRVEMKVKKAA